MCHVAVCCEDRKWIKLAPDRVQLTGLLLAPLIRSVLSLSVELHFCNPKIQRTSQNPAESIPPPNPTHSVRAKRAILLNILHLMSFTTLQTQAYFHYYTFTDMPDSLQLIQRLAFRYGYKAVIYSYKKNQRDALISQINFWNRILHVSDRFSVHHQESITAYTAIGICHTRYADCLLAGSGWN